MKLNFKKDINQRVKLTHMDDVDDSNQPCHIYESIFMQYIT